MGEYKPKRVTDHAQRILDVLRNQEAIVKKYNAEKQDGIYILAKVDAQGWMNRSLIAYGIGKKRLTPYDISLLELLERKDLIEGWQPDSDSPFGYIWMYRAK